MYDRAVPRPPLASFTNQCRWRGFPPRTSFFCDADETNLCENWTLQFWCRVKIARVFQWWSFCLHQPGNKDGSKRSRIHVFTCGWCTNLLSIHFDRVNLSHGRHRRQAFRTRTCYSYGLMGCCSFAFGHNPHSKWWKLDQQKSNEKQWPQCAIQKFETSVSTFTGISIDMYT